MEAKIAKVPGKQYPLRVVESARHVDNEYGKVFALDTQSSMHHRLDWHVDAGGTQNSLAGSQRLHKVDCAEFLRNADG